MKAFEIPNILESIIDRVELTTNYWVLYDLARLIVVILYESHICCCGLYYVGLLDSEKSWIIESDLINDTWIVKYVNEIYILAEYILLEHYYNDNYWLWGYDTTKSYRKRIPYICGYFFMLYIWILNYMHWVNIGLVVIEKPSNQNGFK